MSLTIPTTEDVRLIFREEMADMIEGIRDDIKQPIQEWMDIKQVARYVGASVGTIRNRMRDKNFPVSKRLGLERFNKFLVDEWMKNQA